MICIFLAEYWYLLIFSHAFINLKIRKRFLLALWQGRLDDQSLIPSNGDYSSLLHIQAGPEAQSVSTEAFPGAKAAEHWVSTLPLPSAMAENMWTIAFTSSVDLRGL